MEIYKNYKKGAAIVITVGLCSLRSSEQPKIEGVRRNCEHKGNCEHVGGWKHQRGCEPEGGLECERLCESEGRGAKQGVSYQGQQGVSQGRRVGDKRNTVERTDKCW